MKPSKEALSLAAQAYGLGLIVFGISFRAMTEDPDHGFRTSERVIASIYWAWAIIVVFLVVMLLLRKERRQELSLILVSAGIGIALTTATVAVLVVNAIQRIGFKQ